MDVGLLPVNVCQCSKCLTQFVTQIKVVWAVYYFLLCIYTSFVFLLCIYTSFVEQYIF